MQQAREIFKELEELIHKLSEDVVSLANERETLKEGIEALNKILKEKLYITPEAIKDMRIYFLTDEEDLVLDSELKEKVQKISTKYKDIINDDEKYKLYLSLVNLLNVLDEDEKNYFPNFEKIKVLKNKAKAKLESVRREFKRKNSELAQLNRFEEKLKELKEIFPKLQRWKIEECKDLWELIGYFPRRKKLLALRKRGEFFNFKKDLVLKLLNQSI